MTDRDALRQAAAELANLFAVFPLQAGKKIPLAGSHGFLDAVADPARAWNWWSRNASNIGYVPGPDYIGIDIDCGPGHSANGFETLQKLEEELGPLPDTWTVRTPSGGKHLIYSWPDHGISQRNDWRPGIDLKGSGGYLIAPPSWNAEKGAAYSWVPGRSPADCSGVLGVLPEAWQERITADLRADAAREAEKKRQQSQMVPSGSGDSPASVEAARRALDCIDPDIGRGEWIRVIMACKSGWGDALYDACQAWSRKGSKYREKDWPRVWNSFHGSSMNGQAVTGATLFYIAGGYGWTPAPYGGALMDSWDQEEPPERGSSYSYLSPEDEEAVSELILERDLAISEQIERQQREAAQAEPPEKLLERAEEELRSSQKVLAVSARAWLESHGIERSAWERLHCGVLPHGDHAVITAPMGGAGWYMGIDTMQGTERASRGSRISPIGAEFLDADSEQACLYVCSSCLDALACMTGGREALALHRIDTREGGQADMWRPLTALLAQKKTARTLLLCLNCDETGRASEKLLAAELKRLNVSFVSVSAIVCGSSTAPADALAACGAEAFAGRLEEAESRTAPQPDAVSTYMAERMQADIEAARGRILTGFQEFDELSGGLYNGLYVLGAITSLGKTTWALQLANSIARRGKHVIFFSLEMSTLELVSKSLACRFAEEFPGAAPVASINIRQGGQHLKLIADHGILEAYQKDTAPLLNVVEGNFNCDADFLCEYVRQYCSRNSTKPVVIVDYLQILEPGSSAEKYQSTRETVDATVKALKRLSRELALPVLVLSSLNRANYLLPVSEESFKESGGIEYSADCVLGMDLELLDSPAFDRLSLTEKREAVQKARQEDPRLIRLSCLKNRYGKSGWQCHYRYFPACDCFQETAAPLGAAELPKAGSRKRGS